MKKSRLLSTVITLFLLTCLLLSGCSPIVGTAAGRQVWKVSCMGNDDNPTTKGFLIFKEELEKRVGDKIEVRVLANGQLGTSSDQTLGGLQNGIIEFCDVTLGNVAEYSYAFLPLDIPYLVLDRAGAFALIDGEIGDLMKERYEQDTGIRLIGVFDYGFRQTTNNKQPIHTPADLKNLKIRTMNNNTHILSYTTWGASPTVMAYSEVFTGLQQGTIDGQENPVKSVYESKFYEIQRYLSMTDHVYGLIGMHMSAKLYDSQPPEIQKAIDEAAAIAVTKQRELCEKANSEALELLMQTGKCEVNYLTMENKLAFKELLGPVKDYVSERVGEAYLNSILEYADALQNG